MENIVVDNDTRDYKRGRGFIAQFAMHTILVHVCVTTFVVSFRGAVHDIHTAKRDTDCDAIALRLLCISEFIHMQSV